MTENSTQKIRKIKPVDHPVGCLYSKPYEIFGKKLQIKKQSLTFMYFVNSDPKTNTQHN